MGGKDRGENDQINNGPVDLLKESFKSTEQDNKNCKGIHLLSKPLQEIELMCVSINRRK